MQTWTKVQYLHTRRKIVDALSYLNFVKQNRSVNLILKRETCILPTSNFLFPKMFLHHAAGGKQGRIRRRKL